MPGFTLEPNRNPLLSYAFPVGIPPWTAEPPAVDHSHPRGSIDCKNGAAVAKKMPEGFSHN